jgi:hypothetical protein
MRISGTVPLERTLFHDSGRKIRDEKENDTFSNVLKSSSAAPEETADELAESAGKPSGITESGRNSTGANKLTDVQKQYLKDQYDMGGLSDQEFDSLLADLTNMGALSYQDYRLAHMMSAHIGPSGIVYFGTRDSNEQEAPVSGDAVTNFRQANRQEAKYADYARVWLGVGPSNGVSKTAAAHRRIEELLEELGA